MKRQKLWQYITCIMVVMLMGVTLCACHKDDDVISGSEVEAFDPAAPMHLYLGVNAGNGLSWEEQSGTRAFFYTRANNDTRAGEIRPEKLIAENFYLFVDGDEKRPDKDAKDQSYIQSFMPESSSPSGIAPHLLPCATTPTAGDTVNSDVDNNGSIIIDPFFNQVEGNTQTGYTTIEDLYGDGQQFVTIDYNVATNHQNTGDSNSDAMLIRSHQRQYRFMGLASTAGASADVPVLGSLMEYMNNQGTSYLQWNDYATVMGTQCTMLIAKPAKTHDPNDPNDDYEPTYATRDGDLILKDGYAYIPLVLRPAMACIQLCFHLSYKRAMTSGGAESDDVGFRQYVITGISVQQGKTPVLTESGKSNLDGTGDAISRTGKNDKVLSSEEMIPLIDKYADGSTYDNRTLISDQQDGNGDPLFTPIARFYVLPQSSNTEIKLPITITYDVYDRDELTYDASGNVTSGHLLRKGETANSTLLISSRNYQPGYYYNIKIKIVPDFLYVMSDIDPDKPDDYVVVKNQ